MFHSKKLGKKVNTLHERALRITYGNKYSSLNELLEKDNSVSIRHKNLQALTKEMYEVSKNMPPTIISYIFESRATLITCLTLLVLKCGKSIPFTMVLKLYLI